MLFNLGSGTGPAPISAGSIKVVGDRRVEVLERGGQAAPCRDQALRRRGVPHHRSGHEEAHGLDRGLEVAEFAGKPDWQGI